MTNPPIPSSPLPLILASASPRRRELLAQIGITARVMAANVDEAEYPNEDPRSYVRRIAASKVQTIAANYPQFLVLGADTTVVCDGRILGKPENTHHAAAMLTALSGRSHQVWTGVCIAQAERMVRVEVLSTVYFRPLNSADVNAYIASGEPMDKAGAYGIQGLGAVFVAHLEGSYSSVMGLPLFETAKLLTEMGYPVLPVATVDSPTD